MSCATKPVPRRQLLHGASAVVLGAALTPTLSACGGGRSDPNSFRIQQYESPDSAQYKGWEKALEIFSDRHPELDVQLVQTSFDNMQKNAKILLMGRDVPDVVEVNKGNADAGQLAAQGLVLDLSDEAAAQGWDKKVEGSMASLAKYTSQGNAGDAGDWYGVPNIGEYVQIYYNKEMFRDAGVDGVPATADELRELLDLFVERGQPPLSSSANTNGGWGAMWTWYSLVSAVGKREDVDDFMFLRGDVDFRTGTFKDGTDLFQDWIESGYLGSKLGGVNSDQAQVSFVGRNFPMLLSNSGSYSTIGDQVDFEWDSFIVPEANLTMGSSGHLWAVPESSAHPDLAYEWIDITLSEEVQNEMGRLGGLPLAGDSSVIEDDKLRTFTETFDALKTEKMSFYPDYPVPGFTPELQSGMQGMTNRTKDSDEFLDALQTYYDDGKKTLITE